MHIHQPRLDHGVPIPQVDLEDSFHPRQADHHSAADRQRPPRQTCPRPARHERHAMLVTDLHDLFNLLSCGRKNNEVRDLLLDDIPVALIDQPLIGIDQKILITDDVSQLGEQFRIHEGRSVQSSNKRQTWSAVNSSR